MVNVEEHFEAVNPIPDFHVGNNRRAERTGARKAVIGKIRNKEHFEPQYQENGVKRIVLAMVLQALIDFRADPKNFVLKKWLLEDGFEFMQLLNQPVSDTKWRKFVEAGCPEKHGRYMLTKGLRND